MMRCKCGAWMIWNSSYSHGIYVTWYSCPICGYDTRDYRQYCQTMWSDHTESEDKE